MGSNVFEKYANKSIASRFFCTYSFDDSINYRNQKLWMYFSEIRSDFSSEFSQLQVKYDTEAMHYRP